MSVDGCKPMPGSVQLCRPVHRCSGRKRTGCSHAQNDALTCTELAAAQSKRTLSASTRVAKPQVLAVRVDTVE